MAEENSKKFVIDFGLKRTEYGWGSLLRDFGLNVTPIWFNWITWVITLGAIQFMHQQTGAVGFLIIWFISIWLMFWYFLGIFERFEFRGLPFSICPKIRPYSSAAISGLSAFVAHQSAILIAGEIAKFQTLN